MQYFSLNQKAPIVSFQEAVIQGIAPDKGLYFPVEIPKLEASFWQSLNDLSVTELAVALMAPFVGDSIPKSELEIILAETLDFDFPLVQLTPAVHVLELYHGPTMAFKDVGARFMARSLGYLMRNANEPVTVLVATSGDTGGAVANGFYNVPGVQVVILYPEGKVSDIQERQLTTLGQNITALKVKGSFDDCQHMVKQAFLDSTLNQKLKLTSANSINVARWIPQMLYYVLAYRQLNTKVQAPVFSVPSGNFGNICAGMLAHKMGMPCKKFIAATNNNDTIPRFMLEKLYRPNPTQATLSNAMDVSDPSNFVRVLELFNTSHAELSREFISSSYSDEQTLEAMKFLFREYGYVSDPHGAIGYLGLRDYLLENPNETGIFLETAHPIKFKSTVSDCLNINLDIPEQIQKVLHTQGKAISINNYEEVKSFLLSN
jgi:threonine synthase